MQRPGLVLVGDVDRPAEHGGVQPPPGSQELGDRIPTGGEVSDSYDDTPADPARTRPPTGVVYSITTWSG